MFKFSDFCLGIRVGEYRKIISQDTSEGHRTGFLYCGKETISNKGVNAYSYTGCPLIFSMCLFNVFMKDATVKGVSPS